MATPADTRSTPRANRALILASLAAVCSIWGSTYLGIRIGLETLPPFLMAGVRFVIAGALLYAFLRLRGAPAPTRVEWKNAAVIGLLLCAAGNGLVTLAQQWVTSSLAAIVVATIPLWAAVFSAHAGVLPSRLEWAALGLGFAGVALLNLGGDLESSGWLGALAILTAPIAWAYGSVRAQRVALPKGAMATAAEMLAGGTGLLAMGLVAGERVPEVISLRSGLALTYLIVFGSIVGFSAYGYLLRHTRASVATAYAYVNPLVAMVLGALIAGEKLGTGTLGAAAAIVGSVALLAWARAVRAGNVTASNDSPTAPELSSEVRAAAAPIRGS